MSITHIYARLYVDNIDHALATLTKITHSTVTLRFRYGDLELATLDGFLLVAGTAEALAPFRQTQATVGVTDIEEVHQTLVEAGAEILYGPQAVPTGKNMTARHPDGAIIEYVELNPDKVAALS